MKGVCFGKFPLSATSYPSGVMPAGVCSVNSQSKYATTVRSVRWTYVKNVLRESGGTFSTPSRTTPSNPWTPGLSTASELTGSAVTVAESAPMKTPHPCSSTALSAAVTSISAATVSWVKNITHISITWLKSIPHDTSDRTLPAHNAILELPLHSITAASIPPVILPSAESVTARHHSPIPTTLPTPWRSGTPAKNTRRVAACGTATTALQITP